MPDVPYTRRLVQYAKLESATSVMVQLEGVLTVGDQEITFPLPDEYPDDEALIQRAQTEGKSTWDEDTICADRDCVRGRRPGPPPGPPPGPVPGPPSEPPGPPNEPGPPSESPGPPTEPPGGGGGAGGGGGGS